MHAQCMQGDFSGIGHRTVFLSLPFPPTGDSLSQPGGGPSVQCSPSRGSGLDLRRERERRPLVKIATMVAMSYPRRACVPWCLARLLRDDQTITRTGGWIGYVMGGAVDVLRCSASTSTLRCQSSLSSRHISLPTHGVGSGRATLFAWLRTIAPVLRPFFGGGPFWSMNGWPADLMTSEWSSGRVSVRPGRERSARATRRGFASAAPTLFSSSFRCPFLSVSLGSVLCSTLS